MQILKPASFTGTSHYPLLLLVYVGTFEDTRARRGAFTSIVLYLCAATGPLVVRR